MNPLYGLAFSYGDCVLNANIPSLLGGMNDARLEKYATTNADGDFFGIRNGVKGLEEGKNSDNYKAIVSKPNLVATSPAILLLPVKRFFWKLKLPAWLECEW